MARFAARELAVRRFAAERPQLFDQNWQTEEGLPQNSVNAVLQTREGYLWLATFNGLARFDGVRLTIFDTSQTPALVNSRITSLFEDKQPYRD